MVLTQVLVYMLRYPLPAQGDVQVFTACVTPEHMWDAHIFPLPEETHGKRSACCSTACAVLPHWDFYAKASWKAVIFNSWQKALL